MIRVRYGVALMAALAAVPAHADIFESRLLHADGRPAAHYSIQVVGRPLETVSDEAGRFRFSPAPTPPFAIVAVSPSGHVEAPLEITQRDVPEMRLLDVMREMVTVVSGVAPSLDALPGSAATVLTREELELRAPQRLYQTLESVAGASKLGEGADSVPALRNLGRGRTLLMIDGARVTAERRAGPSATFLEAGSLASVEVMRGPGSVVYGSDALGGVLNVLTLEPDDQEFTLRYGLEAGFEALPGAAGFAAASFAYGRHSFLLEGHARDTDETLAGGGDEIFNSSYSAAGGALRYNFDTSHGRFRAGFMADDVDELGKAAIDSQSIRAFYPIEESRRLTATWLGTPAGAWDTTEVSLFGGTYHVILDRDRAPTPTSNRRIDRADTDATDASLRAFAGRPIGGGRLQVGADAVARFGLASDVAQIRYDADGSTIIGVTETPSIEDAQQLANGIFATWTKPLTDHFTLGVGARGDRVRSENTGGYFGDQSRTSEAFSGNVALTVGPFAGWTTTAQLARGFRVPTLSDRYFRGPSGRGFVTGNPELDPETSLQGDLSTRWRRGRTAIGFFAYHYRIDDLIERYGSGTDFFFRNRGSATIEGLEAEAQIGIGDDWTIETGAAVSDGEADGGDPIDDIAPVNGWVTVRRSFGRAFAFARLGGALRHDDPGPTELERPGYGLIDLGGGMRFSELLELRVAIRNAADRNYTAAPDNSADQSPGRSFTFSLGGRW